MRWVGSTIALNDQYAEERSSTSSNASNVEVGHLRGIHGELRSICISNKAFKLLTSVHGPSTCTVASVLCIE